MIRKMLKIQAIGLILLGANVEANTAVNCDDLTGCKKKICSIEKELAIAKKMENTSRVEGLQISLEKVNAHCTDDKLIEDIEDKIKDTKKDLQEDREGYEEALKDNRPDKIEKYQTKMSEENNKIKKLEQELEEIQ